MFNDVQPRMSQDNPLTIEDNKGGEDKEELPDLKSIWECEFVEKKFDDDGKKDLDLPSL